MTHFGLDYHLHPTKMVLTGGPSVLTFYFYYTVRLLRTLSLLSLVMKQYLLNQQQK